MKDNLDKELWTIHSKENDWEEEPLSENEVKRLTNLTLEKINKENTTENKKIKSRFKKKSTRNIAVFASIAVVIAATAGFGFAFHWNESLVRFFQLYGKEETTNVQGENLHVSQVVDNVKVSAVQVVGDENGCSILIKVTGTQYQTCFGFQNLDIAVEGVKDLQYGDLIPMGADEGADSYVVNLRTPVSLEGKEIQVRLKNYVDVSYDEQGKEHTTVVAKGNWNLSFTLHYSQVNTNYETNQDIALFGGNAKFTKVSISPFSVTVTYNKLKNASKETENPNDTIKVQMMDGDLINSARADAEDIVYDDEDGRIIFYLKRVISDKEVESVTFAGKTVKIHDNDNELITVPYENQEMGFTMEVPQELKDILKTPVSRKYHDQDFDQDAVKVVFTGEIEGVSMDMFSIIELKGVRLTPEEVEVKNPMCGYLGANENGTYVILYGELMTDKQYELFPDLLNKYVANIAQRIDLIPSENE